MRSLVTTFVLICGIFVTACVPSLHPLYTEADLTMDASLVGTWIDKESGESWTISSCEKLKYSLVHTDSDGYKGQYDARLVRVEGKLFLDLLPVKPALAQSDFHKDRFIPTHSFVHIVIRESSVQVSYLEPKWLKDFLADNPEGIRHEKINGEIVLTSSPKETQRFLLGHLTTRGAFSQPDELMRKRGGL